MITNIILNPLKIGERFLDDRTNLATSPFLPLRRAWALSRVIIQHLNSKMEGTVLGFVVRGVNPAGGVEEGVGRSIGWLGGL